MGKYYVAQGIDHVTYFNDCIIHALKKKFWIIVLVDKRNYRYLKWAYKFGV